jgi:hypothetical protein
MIQKVQGQLWGSFSGVKWGILGILREIDPSYQHGFESHNSLIIKDTDGGTRTRTRLPSTDFKSVASTIPPRRLFN